MLTNPPVPYDFCVGVPISRLLIVESMPVQHSVLKVCGEGPSRGFLRDCTTSLINRLQHYTSPHPVLLRGGGRWLKIAGNGATAHQAALGPHQGRGAAQQSQYAGLCTLNIHPQMFHGPSKQQTFYSELHHYFIDVEHSIIFFQLWQTDTIYRVADVK